MTRAGLAGGDGPPSGLLGAPPSDPSFRPPHQRGFPPKLLRGSSLPPHHLITPCFRHIAIATPRLSVLGVWAGVRHRGRLSYPQVVPWGASAQSASQLPPPRGGARPTQLASRTTAALIHALAGAAVPGPAHTTKDKHVKWARRSTARRAHAACMATVCEPWAESIRSQAGARCAVQPARPSSGWSHQGLVVVACRHALPVACGHLG